MRHSPTAIDPPPTYRTLNDAALLCPQLAAGATEIWYATVPNFGSGPDPKADNLSATHTLLGKINEDDLETIFMVMQGERWSPGGEAYQLIKGLGLSHTSMSVGDVVVIGGQARLCAMSGWRSFV